MEQSEAQAVNLHQLVSGVMEAREPEWKRKGILVENSLPLSPIEVYADESELEQVFLSLLIHVEHAVQDQATKKVRVSSRVLGVRVQTAIDFSSPALMPSIVQEPTSGDSSACEFVRQSRKVMGETFVYSRRWRVDFVMNWNYRYIAHLYRLTRPRGLQS